MSICAYCEVEFNAGHGNVIYCSSVCRSRARRARLKNQVIEMPCKYCGKQLTRAHEISGAMFCDRFCYADWERTAFSGNGCARHCKTCGALLNTGKVFCSARCASNSRFSLEDVARMRHMLSDIQDGMQQSKVALKYGVSRQRVSQIAKRLQSQAE